MKTTSGSSRVALLAIAVLAITLTNTVQADRFARGPYRGGRVIVGRPGITYYATRPYSAGIVVGARPYYRPNFYGPSIGRPNFYGPSLVGPNFYGTRIPPPGFYGPRYFGPLYYGPGPYRPGYYGPVPRGSIFLGFGAAPGILAPGLYFGF